MTRTSAFLVPLLLLGCASGSPRPMPASTPARPPDTIVRVADQRFMFRMPSDWWHQADDGDDGTTTLVRERGRITMTMRVRPLAESGYVATVEDVRRQAYERGAEMPRGSHVTHVADQFGRRAMMPVRGMTDGGEVQDGEITVLELEGHDGVIVIEACWPESPSSWMLDEVHHIVDSIRVLP